MEVGAPKDRPARAGEPSSRYKCATSPLLSRALGAASDDDDDMFVFFWLNGVDRWTLIFYHGSVWLCGLKNDTSASSGNVPPSLLQIFPPVIERSRRSCIPPRPKPNIMGNNVCCSTEEDEEALITGGEEFIYTTATLDDYYKNNDEANNNNNNNTLSLHDDEDGNVGTIDHTCRLQSSNFDHINNNNRVMDSMDSITDTPFDERLMGEDEEDEEDVVVVGRPCVSSTSIPLQPPPPMPPNNNNDNNNNKRNNNDDRNTKIRTDVINDPVIQRNNDQPVSTKRDDTNYSSIFSSTTNVTYLCNTGVGGDNSTVKDKLVEEMRIKHDDSRLARYQRVRNFALWKDKMKRKQSTAATCENSSGSKVLSSTKSSSTTQQKITLAPTFSSSSYDDDDDYDENPAIRSPSDEELKDFDFLVHLA